ncbi:MAG: hypothetical protein JO101_05735, partial [Candidatus Eremiobacteraeota bacterium]|nr:hypothetical protein [Candidatus Eremiobacteraeota bacterium]
MQTHDAIDTLLVESRRFPPPPEIAAKANAQPGIYEEAERDPEGWWAARA